MLVDAVGATSTAGAPEATACQLFFVFSDETDLLSAFLQTSPVADVSSTDAIPPTTTATTLVIAHVVTVDVLAEVQETSPLATTRAVVTVEAA